MLSREMIQALGLGGLQGSDEMFILRSILRGFAVFPYENVSKIIKFADKSFVNSAESFREPQEIIEDHREKNLGGTCFSLTWFLKRILDYYGFNSYFITADMKVGHNVHCAAVTIIDKKNTFLIRAIFFLNRSSWSTTGTDLNRWSLL